MAEEQPKRRYMTQHIVILTDRMARFVEAVETLLAVVRSVPPQLADDLNTRIADIRKTFPELVPMSAAKVQAKIAAAVKGQQTRRTHEGKSEDGLRHPSVRGET